MVLLTKFEEVTGNDSGESCCTVLLKDGVSSVIIRKVQKFCRNVCYMSVCICVLRKSNGPNNPSYTDTYNTSHMNLNIMKRQFKN